LLSKEENELLTRTGPGTPMGTLMRRFWMPALLASELPEPDGAPIRTRLLGEDLIAFRDCDGQIGLLGANCPHRGASLFFGRNEEHGLRCVYHGWKYDRSGQCVDMPSEPPESAFKERIRARAYPCVERGGVVWTYMGVPEQQPGVPELEWCSVPEKQRFHSKRWQECNWLQAMEGGIDSSHISFLHGGRPPATAGNANGNGSSSGNRSDSPGYAIRLRDTSPRFEISDTDYGMLIGARRNGQNDTYYWRITQWLFPWYTMIPPFGDVGIGGHAWVPMDDENVWAWSFTWHPVRPFPDDQLESMATGGGIHCVVAPTTFRPLANRDNDYLLDRDRQRGENFTGIQGIGTQDCAVQESMGRIYDRTGERLGTSDAAIIAARRRLLDALRAHERGEDPPGLDPESFRVRSYSTILPRDVPWVEGGREGLIARPDKFVVSV